MNLPPFSAITGKRGTRDMTSRHGAGDSDALARLARLIYDQMDVEPRQMHVAIEIAKEQLKGIRALLISRGLRRPDMQLSADV